MGVFAVIFHYIGISMGWLYEFMGTLLGSAVVPIALCISVKKANRMGCVVGALSGFASGITGWLVATSKLNNGVINVETTGGDYEMLTGNLLSIGIGAIVSLTWTYLRPDDFDWEITRNMAITGHTPAVTENLEGVDMNVDDTPFNEKDKSSMEKVDETQQTVAAVDEEGLTTPEEIERAGLHKAFRFAAVSALLLTAIFLVLIPLPLFFSSTVFGVKGFTAWVIIGMIWVFLASFVVVVYPLYESRAGIMEVLGGVRKDMRSWGSGKWIPEASKASS
ncbi:hypothetical protein QFC21_001568 [Naganishia friedmannii]|uniref:Uncharacterized protein n=1 Tax=Naganishia friedmannii TaxID=89922 RepID=A0ACC2W5P9_9TREE|nr:hypothetical protein QFC21_001568 [Naganishia friedmannii]